MSRKRTRRFGTGSESERVKYDLAAIEELKFLKTNGYLPCGIDGIEKQHHGPYLAYYEALTKNIRSQDVVLELGAGSGRHTTILTDISAMVYAVDISPLSLEMCQVRTKNKVIPICAPMVNIPLDSSSVDYIVACGSLSYIDIENLIDEISRLLKPNGSVIFLDSLNHNFVYRLNRRIQYLRGLRSISTIENMPKYHVINKLKTLFLEEQLSTYGTFLWLFEIIRRLLGFEVALKLYLKLESFSQNSRLGFKFLFVGKYLQKK
jgi:ubiquinone/menaquinone biosynthesis C-methylase UbiE